MSACKECGFKTFGGQDDMCRECWEEHFVVNEPADPKAQATVDNLGLTKRQYFAALAMQGLLAQPAREMPGADWLGTYAVKYADALLVALGEEP